MRIKVQIFIVVIVLLGSILSIRAQTKIFPLRISTQQRVPLELKEGAFRITNSIQSWSPAETAIIIYDMWGKHCCPDATDRVDEMAPAMNEVLSIARGKGVKIVHAPSDCMDYYGLFTT